MATAMYLEHYLDKLQEDPLPQCEHCPCTLTVRHILVECHHLKHSSKVCSSFQVISSIKKSEVYRSAHADFYGIPCSKCSFVIFTGLETLPSELQRNFNLMRDLDSRSQDLMKQIDKMASEYLGNCRNMVPHKRTDHLDSIQKMFTKSKEFGDDKVQLAMQTYELVDKHIRKLDADLARFEADLKEKSLSQQKESSDGKKNKEKKKRKSMKEEFEDEIPKKKKKKGQPLPEEETPPLPSLLSIAHPSDVLDMPVDPNEPTYCLCHQVSYGEMIGCDNPDCPIEWFHFACVGLTTKPKGKWYCPRCQEERKKK
ncbi:inhibitor of growth protein 5-like [Gigantopelta aegis]|uniref:inhibitor of growth protein 5-like n=1 Tax=Gigantopelta aegis TaxID=1735272 RepID=UPI001B8881D2|nr:inhibitor of growth protein 5-like [Gigantopelta aegis]